MEIRTYAWKTLQVNDLNDQAVKIISIDAVST